MKSISIIVPARNEAKVLSATLTSLLAAAAVSESRELSSFHLDHSRVELLVVDNDSDDGTSDVIEEFKHVGVKKLFCRKRKAAAARNLGAQNAIGEILVFVDADTSIPNVSLAKIERHVNEGGYGAGIFRLADRDNAGLRARVWWAYWNQVRRLPLAGAKALPAFMFCTRSVFEEYGPFDENRVIAEEWPILASLYSTRPDRLIYDQSITAYTSSRRMEQQRFGYSRLYLKYAWAILHESGRTSGYSDRFR